MTHTLATVTLVLHEYTVIARRWRPKKFEDVIGQPHIVTTLRNSIKREGSLTPISFPDRRGVGKTSLARILAKAVNCTRQARRRSPATRATTASPSIAAGFVDIIEIDAASARGIDEIKELRETVRYMPMKGTIRSTSSTRRTCSPPRPVNAFLKTLEEPPGHSIFILATTEPQKIPYTIMSRCQRFDFRRISRPRS